MSSLEVAVTGAIASALANTVVYPLDLSKTIIQTQSKSTKESKKYSNVVDCIIKIIRRKGLSKLYQGLPVTLLGNIVQSFCYFYFYSRIKEQYLRCKLIKLRIIHISTIEELLLGIVAASISQFFVTPINVVSTKQQTIEEPNEAKFNSVLQSLLKKDRKQLWKGLKVSLLLTINPSITYTAYQKLKTFFYPKQSNNLLQPGQNFLLGVLAKAISTVLTQPLIVTKATLQGNTEVVLENIPQVLVNLYRTEGVVGFWKGLLPQLIKGILVQGLLFSFKDELSKLVRRLIFVYKYYYY
ncbi:hypothetical protein KAFR_0A05350 [Kazachstania africana CBS 2517]|uniref:Mitochondrial carrier protein n=1 Tax=Kazachstania africana (strain ATCC 22294 / BCRC 22015 / CBS 2517 / CECT 1963 / NBRC 1671 / NRRL Y-8276) TaxID=1071382 RepID=H2ANM0_KAZAF|nr:hypothetical protein KAFR_0A05350 [Kazachstania africana CBS 2517]CCF55970.1 hypothetical protein KAFR_0A05350 [Kazachstania africana CBS 2517]